MMALPSVGKRVRIQACSRFRAPIEQPDISRQIAFDVAYMVQKAELGLEHGLRALEGSQW